MSNCGRRVADFLSLVTINIAHHCYGVFWFPTEGRHYLDFEGGAMLLATHQSVMDPVLVGLIANRRLNYLARKTLFKNAAFGFLIRLLDAIEIDRDRGGLSGLKEMLKRLKRDEAVLMFPEGTRTMDGQVGTLKARIYTDRAPLRGTFSAYCNRWCL